MLVTLQQAKDHLRVDDDALDDDILLKISQVSYLCKNFVKVEQSAYLDEYNNPLDVPPYLSAACLVWLGILFKHRDGQQDENLDFGYIPKAVSNILWPFRNPTYA